jgi:hypothetical protein
VVAAPSGPGLPAGRPSAPTAPPAMAHAAQRAVLPAPKPSSTMLYVFVVGGVVLVTVAIAVALIAMKG